MSEFKDKVEQYKQKIQEAGFTTGDDIPDMSGESGITDVPNIYVEDDLIDQVPQEEVHQEPSQDEQKQKSRKESRKVEGLKKRIEEVTYEKRIREAQTKDLLAKLQEQERRLSDQQSLLEQNEQYKNSYYENNLQIRETAILNELRVAKEEGDIEKEIALSKDLAKVAADQSTHGLYKSQLRNQPTYEPRPTYNDPNIYPEPTFGHELHTQDNSYDYEEPVNEVYDTWLDKNSWADPTSRNFSPSLREEATKLANELDEMLRYNGEGDVIGTQSYYDEIDKEMSKKYGIKNVKQNQESLSKSQYSPYSVAPVSRNGSSMADQYMQRNPNSTRNSVQLTEEEYKIARNLQVKMPDGTWKSGPEAMRRYMEGKKIPQHKPGSHKLIID